MQAQITSVVVSSEAERSKALPKGFYTCAYLLFSSTTKMASTTKCLACGIFRAEIGVTLTEIQTHRTRFLLKHQNFVTGFQETCIWQQIASSVSYLDVQNGVERSSRMEWRDLGERSGEI